MTVLPANDNLVPGERAPFGSKRHVNTLAAWLINQKLSDPSSAGPVALTWIEAAARDHP